MSIQDDNLNTMGLYELKVHLSKYGIEIPSRRVTREQLIEILKIELAKEANAKSDKSKIEQPQPTEEPNIDYLSIIKAGCSSIKNEKNTTSLTCNLIDNNHDISTILLEKYENKENIPKEQILKNESTSNMSRKSIISDDTYNFENSSYIANMIIDEININKIPSLKNIDMHSKRESSFLNTKLYSNSDTNYNQIDIIKKDPIIQSNFNLTNKGYNASNSSSSLVHSNLISDLSINKKTSIHERIATRKSTKKFFSLRAKIGFFLMLIISLCIGIILSYTTKYTITDLLSIFTNNIQPYTK